MKNELQRLVEWAQAMTPGVVYTGDHPIAIARAVLEQDPNTDKPEKEAPGHLTFARLRAANMQRVGIFKNRHGDPAHTKPDGSDWSVAEWMQALVGEFGEFARVRLDYEMGNLTQEQYERLACKEVADQQIYLDLMAARAFDERETRTPFNTRAGRMLRLMVFIGEYAELAKKYRRGDLNAASFAAQRLLRLNDARRVIDELIADTNDRLDSNPGRADPFGMDLGRATKEKFNEVSDRIDVDIKL